MFVPGKPFQPSVYGLSQESTTEWSTCKAGLWPYSQTLDYAGKACQGKTLQLIAKIPKLKM